MTDPLVLPERVQCGMMLAGGAREGVLGFARAVEEAGFDALKTIPAGLWQILRRAFDALVNADEEGRSPIERFVDAVLDGFADAPDDLVDALTLQFDLALEQETGTP